VNAEITGEIAGCGRPGGRGSDLGDAAVDEQFDPFTKLDPTTLPAGGLPMDAGPAVLMARRRMAARRIGYVPRS
jgi:hypothetical protein